MFATRLFLCGVRLYVNRHIESRLTYPSFWRVREVTKQTHSIMVGSV